MDGTGAVGTTTKYAREDHKHPTDTSREAIIAAGTTAQYWRGDKAWQTLDKAAVGLGNVDNTSDASKPVSTATTTALNLKEDKASKGVVNGYASLDAGAKVPAAQLPSYVDDVLEYANLAAFPGSGTTGIIYVALDTNKVYRWSGSAYVEISPSPGSSDAVPEGSVNLYYTAARSALKADLASPTFTGDPRAPTPATADNDTSIATTAHVQANMALKANVSHTHAESDVTNLVSDLALKAPLANPTFTGNPTAPTPTAGDNDTSLATTAFVTTAVAAVTATVTISDTAPGSPSVGSLWWDSASGNLNIYYNDGSSSQWVPASARA